jgi:hypothetical protein
MNPYEPRLQKLAMQLGMRFTPDGFPELLGFDPNRNPMDIGVWSVAALIENSLGFKEISESRRALNEVTKEIEDYARILGKNDRRVQILWEMHKIANAILEENRGKTED